jgi:Tol biopolymer transport system component
MADPRTTVERALGGAEVRPITLDAFHTRRERKRRNQRLAAGALGVSIALAGALVASQVLDGGPDQTAGQTPGNGAIAFQGDRGLFLSDPDGTGYHRTMQPPNPPRECLIDRTHPCDFRGMTWSPNGSRLAFVFGEVSAGLLGDMSIYVMDAATEEVRLLARCPAGPGDPTGTCDNGDRLSWSPDGGQIAVSSEESLFVIDAATGDMTQITGCASCSYQGPAQEPAWSPDGDRIAFTGNDLILSVAVDGSARQTLVRSSDAGISINGAQPRWSPDGTRLAFAADEGMFVVNADGSRLRLLVNHNPDIASPSPSWSPDGRQIVYLETSGSGDAYRAEIRVVDVTGGNDRILYRSGCCIDDWRSPVFSPDGTMIAFSLMVVDASHDLVGSYVFVMDADGGDVRRLPGFGDLAWQALPG